MNINGLQLLEFNITEIVKNQNFAIKEMVNDMTFENQSENSNLYINNTKLVPGQAFNIGGNYREINFQNYNCRFEYTGTGTEVRKCVILLKTYKNVK